MNSKPPGTPSAQEYSICVPKIRQKKHNVMRFNTNLDFAQWKQVKMERENNMKEFKGLDEDQPKFGAGSEFGRDAREEARRKKFGITSKKYKPENQPWILKVGGKTGKKFKGIREGGVSANASYYVFTHGKAGTIEAFPLDEWYKFQPIQRYKALSAEEAEAEFSRRNKTMNYHAIMVRKRLRNDEEGNDEDAELGEGSKKSKSGKKDKELKISEMDEWMDSDDDSDDSEVEKEKKASDDESDGGKKKKKGKAPPKKKKKDSDDEAFEESDDGDEEGRECDYISDSTDSELEMDGKEIKSVAEEDALRKLLASDDEDEDEEKDKKTEQGEGSSDNDENKDKEEKDKAKDGQKGKEKKKPNKKNNNKKKDASKKNGKDSSSDFTSDSGSDSDTKDKDKDKNKMNSGQSSRSATPVPSSSNVDNLKRKMTSSPDISQAKKFKLDNFNSAPATANIPGLAESGITEESVRRYLMRKPMTTTELLRKFKSKETGLKSDDLVNIMTLILKKINPNKQTFKNKMYLSLKPPTQ